MKRILLILVVLAIMLLNSCIALTTTTSIGALSLQVISVTSPVTHGANATLTAKTTPGAHCTITVNYKSGPSTASGLGQRRRTISVMFHGHGMWAQIQLWGLGQ